MFKIKQLKNTLSTILLDIKRPTGDPIATHVEKGYPNSITLYDGSIYMLHLTGIPSNTQDNEIGSDDITGDIACVITTINEGRDSEAVDIRDENVDLILDALHGNRYLENLDAEIIFPINNLVQLSMVKLDPKTRSPPTAVGSVINIIIRKTGG